MNAIITAAALLATTVVAQTGSAIVVNKCSYDVYLADTPAADGGYDAIVQWLGQDEGNNTFTQEWTELSNGDGWSIKLGKDTSLSNIMQYEYTYLNDGIIWYDLSDVNGNPWDGNWEITATNSADDCDPKDQAYRYSTDDAYGMQACSQDSVITVTLCSGDSSDDGGAASASSSVAAASSTASAIASTATSTFTTPSSSAPTWTSFTWRGHEAAVATSASEAATTPAASTPSPTTFATSTSVLSSSATTEDDGNVVTVIDTAVVTDIVTATAYEKRDYVHRHHRHAHA